MDWEGYEIGHVASGMVISIKNRTKFKFLLFWQYQSLYKSF